MLLENTGVLLQQVLALHAGAAGDGTEHNAYVSAGEGRGHVVGAYHAADEGEVRVLELHADAAEGSHGDLEDGK